MTDYCSYPAVAVSALILMFAIFFSGCIAGPANPPVSNDLQTPAATLTPAPVATQTPAASGAAGSRYAASVASLADGVTITYPADWDMRITCETSMRDYGRTSTNIANFFSPDITADRAAKAQPNIDKSTFTTLSIDVDPLPVSDFEQYFNLVAIALQKKYGHIDITKHNYQLKISPTATFGGYKSYEMDFDTTGLRGSYIFTNVDGTIYIFAFKNPTPYSAEIQDMYKSIKIVPAAVTPQKSR
jgi:hypothetical protein